MFLSVENHFRIKNRGRNGECLSERVLSTQQRAKIHFDMVTLVYNASKSAVGQIHA